MIAPRPIKLASPCATGEEERAAVEVIRSGRLVLGPHVVAFEGRLAALAGRAHAVALSSGTAALLAIMHELGVGHGKTVAVSALAFPAAAQAAAFLGARVVACDVEPDTLNASVRTVGEALARAGGADLVVVVDLFGVPAEAAEIERELEKKGVPLIVDAACSIGSSLGGRPCGSFGAAAVFSFHPRKLVTTGEGGAVVTDDAALASRLRRLRNVGAEAGVFHAIGLNLRPPEIGAAIGCVQLDKLEAAIARRGELAARYGALPLRFQSAPRGARVNHQTFAAFLPAGCGAGDRDELIAHLASRGIEAQVASYCLGSIEPLASILGVASAQTPVSRAAADLGIALPLHGALDDGEVDRVADAVRHWLEQRGLAS
jgi:perosamine synthetase